MKKCRKILFLLITGLGFFIESLSSFKTSYKMVPDSFTVYIPIHFFGKNNLIQFVFKKSPTDSSAEISPVNNTFFPDDFYQTLIFSIQSEYGFPSYKDWYGRMEKHHDTLQIVGYKKFIEREYLPNLILVIDINNDNLPEIILQDRDNSGYKNPVCKIYRWIRNSKKFEEIPNFFKGGAFYGWDKSGRYIITGWSPGGTTLNTTLNKVLGDSLKPVKVIIYHGEQISK